ncbi:asparaginase [Micromonospora sp. NPDC049275]|uniref:asparaginase n=1 Tax=Micromonospora sp. NPDC049275 TaxID=3364268 RepID=UPI00371A295A
MSPRVTVFGLGGTIAMTTSEGNGVVPALTAGDLVAAVPGLADTGIAVDVVNFRSRPGASLTFADLADLARSVHQAAAAGTCGIIITQGTDTLEETAYYLHLLHTGPQPLVVTGAMRNPTLAGPDGPANLLAATRVAASPHARDRGALVVMADEIHAADRVRKTHSVNTQAFTSPNGGPLGYVVEGEPRFLSHTAHRHAVPTPVRQPRVGLYTATVGDDATYLSATAAHFDGLVIAGFGVGHVPDTWVSTLTALAQQIPVVLTSRIGAGPVLTSTYGFPGSERDLTERGLIPAGFLDPYKARILLHLTLAAGATAHEAAAAFRAVAYPGEPWPWPQQPPTNAPTV